MKKILLFSAILILSINAYCGCPSVVATIFHSGTTANDYTLAVYLTKNSETFHIQDFIYCDGAQIATGCNTFKENGTLYIQFYCAGAPTARVDVYTQACGSNSKLCATLKAVAPVIGEGLPVVISDFSLQRSSNNVIITWQTQQEVNSDRFEVERSFDNESFELVGTVPSHGNSTRVNNYSYSVNTNTGNPSFFRIKLVDKDGSISFTPIKSIKGNNLKADYAIFPNPSLGNAKITITDLNEPAIVQVLDNSGRLIKSFSLVRSNTVGVDNLQQGTYIIRITGKVSNETTVRKLTVIN